MPNAGHICSTCNWSTLRTIGGKQRRHCLWRDPEVRSKDPLDPVIWPVVNDTDTCNRWASIEDAPAGTDTWRDRDTTIGAITKTLRSVPIPANARAWIDSVVQFRDATNIVGGYLWLTIGGGRGAGAPLLFGTVDVLESHNLAGPSATLVVNVGASSIDLTVTGKAGSTVSWTARTLVDWG